MEDRARTKECPSCKELRAENQRLRERIAQLERRLEELERVSHRQAAPFRMPPEKRKSKRKRPGRKPGHQGFYRQRPEKIDETVEVPLDRCPNCGEAVSSLERVEQFIEEPPEPVRPHVTRLITYRGYCRLCDKEIASHHPLQVSEATGAAGTHLGPRALALGAELRHVMGLTVRKTCRVMERCCGLRITPGGLTQALSRVSNRLEDAYNQLKQQVRSSPVVYADETSWWVDGPKHWLWVFTTPHLTLYRIEDRRGQEVVSDTLGEDFSGVLVSDCLSSYDPIECKKQKCYAHHLRAISEARRRCPDSAYLREVHALLKAAMCLGHSRDRLPDFSQMRQALEENADRLLNPVRGDPTEERVANRLRKQRAHLFRFLYEDAVEATNNRAERQLRPAVIARKLSCGNKTRRGKRTSEVLMSMGVTAQQQGRTLTDILVPVLRLAT